MLAMWHRVMKSQYWLSTNETQNADSKICSDIRTVIASCSLSLVIDEVAEHCDGKDFHPINKIGICKPLSPLCWVEWSQTNDTPQVGWLVREFKRADGKDGNDIEMFMFATRQKTGEVVFVGDMIVELDGLGLIERLIGKNERVLSNAVMVLCGFAFAHCKNVRQLNITAEHGPGAKWCRRQRVSEVTYKTLLIPGFTYKGRIVNSDGTLGEQADEARKMHIVRGHFATYTAEKPLFGRPDGVGKFWHPAHVRGDLRQGAVVKDYEVAPPPPPQPSQQPEGPAQ